MTSQIKHKFTNVDALIEVLKNEVDYIKEGDIMHSIPNVPTVGSIKLKDKEVEKEIVYGLDVKSSIDGMRYHHNPNN